MPEVMYHYFCYLDKFKFAISFNKVLNFQDENCDMFVASNTINGKINTSEERQETNTLVSVTYLK